MTAAWRTARLAALAKINLSLRVLPARPDSYHELRTVFQTVSLADELDLSFLPARPLGVRLISKPEIENNLVVRAAQLCVETLGIRGQVELRLTKRIPMGSGLGGGSSDA